MEGGDEDDDQQEVVPLRVGDYITIRAASMGVDGFLSAEGILDQRSMVHTAPANFDDCKWQICTPNQYSAAKELHEYEENLRALQGDDEGSIASIDGNPMALTVGGGDGSHDDGSHVEGEGDFEDPAHQAEMLHQSLIRGKQSERALNASQFSRMIGTVVKFGDTVQLRHAKSGRYLTVSQTEVATVEKENLKIFLDQEGSSSSLLTLGTRFRIDRDGDPINSQSELIFKVVDGQGMFLRFSIQDVEGLAKGVASKECNCSLDRSFWRVVLFNSFKPPEDPEIMAGDIVRLFEPEFGAYMRLLPMASSTESSHKERGDLFLETQSESSTPDSNALWIVERKDPSLGGGVVYRDEPFRFRHLNTGRYIGHRPAQMWKKATNLVASVINVRPMSRSGTVPEKPDYVVAAQHMAHKSTSVTVHSAHQARSGRAGEGSIPVTDQSAVRLELGGRWLHRGSRNAGLANQFAEEGESLWSVYAQPHKTGPGLLNLMVQRVADEGTMLDALCGVCALPYLRVFSNLASKWHFKDVDEGVGQFRETTITSLINYLYERPFSDNIQFAKAIPAKTGANAISLHRQMFLREQGVLAEVIDLCEVLLTPEWEPEEELKGLITRPCFTLLLNAIYCNPVNQMYVADRLKVFIGHVSSNYMATRCIMEMLATNMDLQESKVNEPEVANFIDMIANSKMGANYVKLLQSVCSCQGRGVDVNQCMVADMWLEGSKHLQVKFIIDEGPRTQVSWRRALPPEIANKGYKYIKGYEVHKNGVPEIFLTWETECPELTPDNLGGTGGRIPLLEIFGEKAENAMKKTKHHHHRSHATLVNPIQKLRHKVAGYVVAQLLLAAEVCLDRNYIAMGMCAESYSFDLLLMILKTDDVAESLSAAVVRLMMCLYVDADPQANLRIPCLTRQWDEVSGKGVKILMPSVDKGNLYDFFLLQDYVWEHMGEMRGHASWDGSELKHCLMALLLKLVQFRYYQDPEDVINLVRPLVASLDNRAVLKPEGRPKTPSDGEGGMRRITTPNQMVKAGAIVPADLYRNSIKANAIVPVDGLDMPAAGGGGGGGGIEGPQRFPLVGPGTSRPDDWRARKSSFLCGIMGGEDMTPLEQLDTFVALAVILLLTFAGIICDMILVPNNVIPTIAGTVFSYFCSFCFTLELTLRLVCYSVIKGPIFPKACRSSSAQYEGPAPVFLSDPLSDLDVLVVFIDIVFISIDILMAVGVLDADGGGGGGASLTRTLRLARLSRLTRILKGARLAHKIGLHMDVTDIDDWKLPARYENTSELHMSTMLETVNVLREVTKITRDYSMSIMMSSYRQWYEGKEEQEPLALFKQCYEDTKHRLSLEKGAPDFDLIFLDLCLYKHHDLVQSVLNVMMIHHNLREIMLNDFTSSQLLVKDEDQARVVAFRKDLTLMRSDAERAELWSDLVTADDRTVNERLKGVMVRLTAQIKVRSSKLRGYQQIYRSDAKVQDMLRNLGAFEVCMTVLELESSLKEVEEEKVESRPSTANSETKPMTPLRIPTAEVIKKRQEDEKTNMVNNNIKELLLLCYEFLSWFVHDNAENQNLAFSELDTFAEALGDGCGAHLVVAEMVRGNPKLIKAFPSKLIIKCCFELSINPDPSYLSILEALVWQANPDALGNLQVQVMILKHLTTPEFEDNIMLVCDDPQSQLYADRKGWMVEALENMANQPADGSGSEDPSAHMPSLLQYHSMLLYVLAGTAVGRTNITTVEAKLQTIYKPDDLLTCLLDPDTTVDVLIPVSNYFFHAVIEVEIAIPGLGQHREMWQYLKVCDEVIGNSRDDFAFLSENPLDASLKAVIARRNCDYALICIRIVLHFFDAYYDRNQMDPEFQLEEPSPPSTPIERQASGRHHTGETHHHAGASPQAGVGGEGIEEEFTVETSLSEGGEDSDEEEKTENGQPFERMWWDDLVASLRVNLIELYRLKPKVLIAEHFSVLYHAIEVTTGAGQEQDVEILMLETPDMLKELAGSFDMSDESGSPQAVSELTDEKEVKLQQFIEKLSVSDDLNKLMEDDKDNMVLSMEKIPSMSEDDTKGDLRFEPLLKKLVRHTRSNLVSEGGFKNLDVDCTKSTKWFIQLFRRMIEKRWGMSIEDRDDDGGEEEDEKAEPVQMMLNMCGVTELCLDLIAVGINSELVKECVKLLVALLFKEGGATKVQTTIFKHLSTTNTQLFFEEMVLSLNMMEEVFKYDELPGYVPGSEGSFVGEGHRWSDDGDGNGEEDEDDDPLADLPAVGENVICVRFLQLMCEGHYGPNQDIMREQLGGGRVTINLLDHMVRLLQVASKKKCRASTKCAAQVTDTILEVIQGPCIQNQNHLAINTELIEILNRMMRAKPINDCVQDEEDEVQLTVLNIFEGLLEGQSQDSQIYDRILSVIDLSVLQVMIVANGDGSDEMNDVQIEGLVLLQMLCDYKPALKAEVNLPERVRKVMGKDVMAVEVVWNHELQRRFFHVPEIAASLADATKSHLVENNNRSSQEEKLGDFVERVYGVQRELKHQEYLRDMNYIELKCPPWSEDGFVIFPRMELPFSLAALFSRQNQEFATWVSFFCCLLINIIMLISFEHIELYAQGDGVYGARKGMQKNSNIGDDDAMDGLTKVWGSGVLGSLNYSGWDHPYEQQEGQVLCDAYSIYTTFKSIKEIHGDHYREYMHDPFELGLIDEDGGPARCDPPVLDQWSDAWFAFPPGTIGDPANGDPLLSENGGAQGLTALLLTYLNNLNKTLAIFTLVLYLAVRCPVRYAETYEKTKRKLYSYFVAVTEPMTMYYFLYVLIAFQAGDHPIYQSYLLIDVVVKDSTTMSVLLAVIIPWKQLTATLVLLVFVTYMFAYVIFLGYANEMSSGAMDCSTLGKCLWANIDYGMRLSGGIGDNMTHEIEFDRSVWDYLYFLIVLVILLNVVFGIIIDTFSDLRSQKNERIADTVGKCFICGIDKLEFDRADDTGASGFKQHISNDHNMWNYLYFIIFIWEQDKDDDDGLELYVREMIEQEDISWFPVNKAICLQGGSEDEQDASHKLDQLNTTMHDLVREQGEMLLRVLEETRSQSMREMTAINRRLDGVVNHNKEAKAHFEDLKENHAATMKHVFNAPLSEWSENGSPLPRVKRGSHGSDESGYGGGGGGGQMHPVGPSMNYSSPPAKSQSGPTFDMVSDVHESPEQPATNNGMRQSELDASQTITVCITNCQDLVLPHLLGSTDPFVVANVFWNGIKVGETETIWYGTAHPAWKNVGRNTFKITLSKNDDIKAGKLSVEVNHTHRRGAGSFLGVAEVPGQQILGAGDSFSTLMCRLVRKAEQHLPRSKQLNVQGSVGLKLRLNK